MKKSSKKKLTKNITSEIINTIILNFSIDIILIEWFPWKEDSIFKSPHHILVININKINKKPNLKIFKKNDFITPTKKTNKDSKAKDKTTGHGLKLAKWKTLVIFIIKKFL